jgi:hypothetical protein
MQGVATKSLVYGHVKYILGTVLVVAPAACSRSPSSGAAGRPSARPDGVQVTTDRSSYRAGDPVTLTVHNGSTDTVTFNPCTRVLEREGAGGWSAVAEPQRICTMEAWLLAPGEQRAGPSELPAHLTAARYRAVLAFTAESAKHGSERFQARSAPFAVER